MRKPENAARKRRAAMRNRREGKGRGWKGRAGFGGLKQNDQFCFKRHFRREYLVIYGISDYCDE